MSRDEAVDPQASGAEDDQDGSGHPLLDIQRLDSEAEQLQHRLATLPERRRLNAAQAEQAQHQREIDDLSRQKTDVLTRQKRLERDAAMIEARADTDDNRLYSGELTGIRDLQALQSEIRSLRKRQGELEESAIEALLEAEDLGERVASVEAERARAEAQAADLQSELASAEAAIDEQLATRSRQRADLAADLSRTDGAVLSHYERLREAFGPSTVVRFDPASGCGCPQHMPAAEVARIKRCEAGSVPECRECGRLVLR